MMEIYRFETGSGYRIRQVRIDVPLRTAHAYLFVDPEQGKWNAWWTSLYEYLLGLASPEPNWRYEPVQGIYVARPELTNEQRLAIVAFLRNAPAREIQEHRTLRRAVELSAAQSSNVDVMYFSAGATSDTGRGQDQ